MNNRLPIPQTLKAQREFFAGGKTRSFHFRQHQLRTLLTMIKDNESALHDALREDLGKPEMESVLSETGFLREEIHVALKNLKDWMAPQKVPGTLLGFRAQSHVHPQPKGIALVIGAWNYPLQLLLGPLIGSIAAGNCAILKPSEFAPSTSDALNFLFKKYFPDNYISLQPGDAQFTQKLLQERFDHIFFTGSTAIGKKVMAAAAEHLTPVTLELGGKSPCIVDSSANLEISARRIVWGKFFNAGQTCVAPDYLLVHDSILHKFLPILSHEIKSKFHPMAEKDYGRIVHKRHFDRLRSYLTQGKIVYGGGFDESRLRIEPTLLSHCSESSPIMQEEIFGPILPILSYSSREDLVKIISRHPHPLAFYVFSKSKRFTDWAINEFSFGGGCVNDTIVHLANPNLPFGGIGPSGMGHYHGRYGFEAFSHQKSVMVKSWYPDIWFRYRPYEKHLGIIKRLIK